MKVQIGYASKYKDHASVILTPDGKVKWSIPEKDVAPFLLKIRSYNKVYTPKDGKDYLKIMIAAFSTSSTVALILEKDDTWNK